MVKYTITIERDGRGAVAYIESNDLLNGDEPIVIERFKALGELSAAPDDFEIAFTEALMASTGEK